MYVTLRRLNGCNTSRPYWYSSVKECHAATLVVAMVMRDLAVGLKERTVGDLFVELISQNNRQHMPQRTQLANLLKLA